MRWIGWLLLILVTLGWLASELPSTAGQTQATQETDWRRTRDGWERSTWAGVAAKPRRLTLHPIVVGLLEMSLALTALIAFGKDRDSAEPPIRP